MPSGVQGTKPGSPAARRPAFTGWKPSTSLPGGTASSTACASAGPTMRQLHQQAVHAGVGAQLAHARHDGGGVGAGRQRHVAHADADLGAGGALALQVDPARPGPRPPRRAPASARRRRPAGAAPRRGRPSARWRPGSSPPSSRSPAGVSAGGTGTDEPADRDRAPGGRVERDERPVQPRVAGRRREALRQQGEEAPERGRAVHADDGVEAAGHARVARGRRCRPAARARRRSARACACRPRRSPARRGASPSRPSRRWSRRGSPRTPPGSGPSAPPARGRRRGRGSRPPS